MQIIGFNLSKILAERAENFQRSPINTNIEFINFEKEKIQFLKEAEGLKVSFKYSIIYGEQEGKGKQAEVSFEGFIIVSAEKEEIKDIQKSWKKKKIPSKLQMFLYNFILKRCSLKAAILEEDMNIPAHIPIPQVKPKTD